MGSRGGERKTGNGKSASTIAIPTSNSESWKDARLTMLRAAHKRLQDRKETMKQNETNESNNAHNGLSIIPRDNEPTKHDITRIDPPQSYLEHLESYDLVGSESMKLIDKSATHLHERMLQSDTIVEAAMCADQITKLLRLKLDIRVKTRD